MFFSELQEKVRFEKKWEKKSKLWNKKSQLPCFIFYPKVETGFHFIPLMRYYQEVYFSSSMEGIK